MKFIHNFDTQAEHDAVYKGGASVNVSAITVDGVTYEYSEPGPNNYYVWVNGESWVDSDGKRNPNVGDNAYIMGESGATIEAVFYEELPETTEVYEEPWVAYIKENGKITYNQRPGGWLRIFSQAKYGDYTEEELDVINHFNEYWHTDKIIGPYDEAVLEIRKDITLYFVDYIVSDFDINDPSTYQHKFTPTRAAIEAGSGQYKVFVSNEDNCDCYDEENLCWGAEFGAFIDGNYVTPGKGEYWDNCSF